MKIQLALDILDEKQALKIVEEIGEYVDIIEIGTSLLKLCGIGIVKKIRDLEPQKEIFIDTKIIDGPKREATLVALSKANSCSMLAVATDKSVSEVLSISKKSGVKVFFDLQSVEKPVSRAIELKKLGATSFCIHKNQDTGDRIIDGFKELLDVREATGGEVSLAGGINLETIKDITDKLNPDVVVVGGALLNSDNRLDVAKKFFEISHSKGPI